MSLNAPSNLVQENMHPPMIYHCFMILRFNELQRRIAVYNSFCYAITVKITLRVMNMYMNRYAMQEFYFIWWPIDDSSENILQLGVRIS